jgi:hypothetical protein
MTDLQDIITIIDTSINFSNIEKERIEFEKTICRLKKYIIHNHEDIQNLCDMYGKYISLISYLKSISEIIKK